LSALADANELANVISMSGQAQTRPSRVGVTFGIEAVDGAVAASAAGRRGRWKGTSISIAVVRRSR
jgi:hypothetical protein